ncbi:MAG: radical SAM protein [Pseudomonadota bacterium]
MKGQHALYLAADLVFRSRIRRVMPALAIFLTDRCNGKCVACPIHQTGGTHQLSLDQIVQIRKEASRLGTMMVLLSGGEPLMHPDILSIINELENKGRMRVNLSTNGSLVNAEMARQLGAVNLTSICVSVESPSREVHDALRGMGSHEEALQAVRLLREHAPGLKVSLGTTITARSLGTLSKMPALARDLGAHAVRVQLVRDGFEQEGLEPEIFNKLKIAPGSAMTLRSELGQLLVQADTHHIRTDSKEYMDDLCRAIEGHRHMTCVAGDLICSVTARGTIRPCPASDVELPLQHGLQAAWNSSRFVGFRGSREHHTCAQSCTDSTYHNLSAALERLRQLRLPSLMKDVSYYSLQRGPWRRS